MLERNQAAEEIPINGVKTSVLRESKDATEPIKQHSTMMTPAVGIAMQFTMSKDGDCHLPDT